MDFQTKHTLLSVVEDICKETIECTLTNSTWTYAGDHTDICYFWFTPWIILGRMLQPLDHYINGIRRTLHSSWMPIAFQVGW